MAFLNDLFTGSAGTAITAHTPDTGGAWALYAVIPYASGNAQLTGAGSLRMGTNANTIAYNAAVPVNADYDVVAVVKAESILADTEAGVVGRFHTSGGLNFYMARYDTFSGTWTMLKYVNGSYGGMLGSGYAQSLTPGQSYTLTLRMVGSAISLLVDGVTRISVTDTGVTAKGSAGVAFGGSGTGPTDSTGLHLASVTATDAVADTVAPTLVSTSPANGGTLSPSSTSVSATFSEAILSGSATTSTARVKLAGTPITGSVGVAGSVVTISGLTLVPSTAYTMEFTPGITDLAGNALASTQTISFTTTAAPVTLAGEDFGGVNGALLNSRPSGSGHNWVQETGDPLALNNGAAYYVAGSSSRMRLEMTPTSNEFDILWQLKVGTVNGKHSLFFRWASGDGYVLEIESDRQRITYSVGPGNFRAARSQRDRAAEDHRPQRREDRLYRQRRRGQQPDLDASPVVQRQHQDTGRQDRHR